MDLLHLILNNGYNPYLIRGYGGLGYIPPYNIIGGTLTEKEKRERLGQLLNEDEDDNELAVTKLLKDVSKLKFIPVLQKPPDISELIAEVGELEPIELETIYEEEQEDEEPEDLENSGTELFNELFAENIITNPEIKNMGNGKAWETMIITDPEANKYIREIYEDETPIRSMDDEVKNILDSDKEFSHGYANVYGELLLDYYTKTRNENKINEISERLELLNEPTLSQEEKTELADLYFNDFEETIKKLRIKDAPLPVWETTPIDLASDKNLYEIKNFISTMGADSVTINNKIYKEIEQMKRRGMTPEEIEQEYKTRGIEIPTVPITKSKLSGFNKARRNDQYYEYDKDNDGNIYAKRLIYKPNTAPKDIYKHNPTLQNNKFLNAIYNTYKNNGIVVKTYTNKPKVNYYLLTNNAVVTYSPLDDSKAKFIPNSKSVLLNYKTDKADKNYLVPYSRINITPIRKK